MVWTLIIASPILFPFCSVNQRLPSKPIVMFPGVLEASRTKLCNYSRCRYLINFVTICSMHRKPEVAVRTSSDSPWIFAARHQNWKWRLVCDFPKFIPILFTKPQVVVRAEVIPAGWLFAVGIGNSLRITPVGEICPMLFPLFSETRGCHQVHHELMRVDYWQWGSGTQ